MARPAGVHITLQPPTLALPMTRLLAQLKEANGAHTLPALVVGARPTAQLVRLTIKLPAHQKAASGVPVPMVAAGVLPPPRKLAPAHPLKQPHKLLQ